MERELMRAQQEAMHARERLRHVLGEQQERMQLAPQKIASPSRLKGAKGSDPTRFATTNSTSDPAGHVHLSHSVTHFSQICVGVASVVRISHLKGGTHVSLQRLLLPMW